MEQAHEFSGATGLGERDLQPHLSESGTAKHGSTQGALNSDNSWDAAAGEATMECHGGSEETQPWRLW